MATIRFGWAKGDDVREVPNAYTGNDEDDYHLNFERQVLDVPDDEMATGWKRWRYRDDVDTLFWWEAPTATERKATDYFLGGVGKQSYVNLQKLDRNFKMDQGGLMDLVHRPYEEPTMAMRHWLDTIGDALPAQTRAVVEALTKK